ERFIHGEIYRARPDVGAVAHSHSPGLIPFGVVASAPLRPIFHMAGFIGDRAPVFEIRDCPGEHPDLLISDRTLGAALAERLGDQGLVLMRGHGSTAVGSGVRQAVYRAVYAEVNARLQSEALRLGEPTYLSGPEALASAAANDTQLDRAWSHWTRLIKGG
ncbi:MAG TPA: class II aldolase/adducin family protein, partial [Caulobacteraceae bacterium]